MSTYAHQTDVTALRIGLRIAFFYDHMRPKTNAGVRCAECKASRKRKSRLKATRYKKQKQDDLRVQMAFL